MTVMQRKLYLSLVVLTAVLSLPLMLPNSVRAADSDDDTALASVTIEELVLVMFAEQTDTYGGEGEYPFPDDLSPLSDTHFDVSYDDLVAGCTTGSGALHPPYNRMTRHGTLHGWRNSLEPFHIDVQYAPGYGGTFGSHGITLYMKADSFAAVAVDSSPQLFWGADGPHGAAPLYWQCVFPNGVNTPSGYYQETVQVDIYFGS